jgi:hypothetical protein
MATAAQIAANRRNSQKSPGPRTPEGKAVSRYNALKSGLDAQSMVIPGESAEELERLVENYRREHRPASPTEQFLVDAMVAADWQLRRLRAIEAELWKQEGLAAGGFAEAYTLDRAFSRLHRRMDAAERSMYKALKELQKMRKGKEEDEAEEAIAELGSFGQRIAEIESAGAGRNRQECPMHSTGTVGGPGGERDAERVVGGQEPGTEG